MSNSISNTDDIIDSRDVIARIEELKSEVEDIESAEDYEPLQAKQDHAEIYDELANLEALADEASGYAADWEHGEQLIRDSYFTDYIEELIKDCYELPKEMNSGEWPYRHMTIDFEAAADEAKQDYTSVELDGVTYWVR